MIFWKKKYENIGDALTGADFVVISILPGTFDEMINNTKSILHNMMFNLKKVYIGMTIKKVLTMKFLILKENIKRIQIIPYTDRHQNQTLCII